MGSYKPHNGNIEKQQELYQAKQRIAELEHQLSCVSNQGKYLSAVTDGSVFLYEVNISENTIIKSDERLSKNLGLDAFSTFMDVITNAAGTIVDSHDQFKLLSKFNTEALLNSYRQGKREIKIEYKRSVDGNAPIWVRTTINLIKTEPNGDVCGLIYVKNIDYLKKSELELINQAERDPLTGLYNRITLSSLMTQQLEKAAISHAMLIIDIDNFKNVNDTFGHIAGDTVLKNFAQLLHKVFRKSDFIGRIGGDEFLVFMPNAETHIAQKRAQEIINGCQSLSQNLSFSACITPSIGISMYPKDGETKEQLFSKADIAAYASKKSGKNCFTVYDENNPLITENNAFQQDDIPSFSPLNDVVNLFIRNQI